MLIMKAEACVVAHVEEPKLVPVKHDPEIVCSVCKLPHMTDHIVVRMISPEGEVMTFAQQLVLPTTNKPELN